MDLFRDLESVYRRVDEYLESLRPASDRIAVIIAENARLAAEMVGPYDRFAREFESIQRAMPAPDSLIDSVRPILSAYQKLLDVGALDFRVASAWLDAVRTVQLRVPEYLLNLQIDVGQLQQCTLSLGDSYDALRDALSLQGAAPVAPAATILRPTLSSAAHFQILSSLGISGEDTTHAFDQDLSAAQERDWDECHALVEKADPAWITLLDGAEQSLRSENPDRVRHTITSLRELLTQIIHRLAPDEDIRTELPEPEWYDKGKPTRRARLRLILSRRYGNDVLLDFVDKDVSAAVEVFELFQRGTHEIVSTITPSELRFIVSRVRLLVCELIYPPAGW